MFTQFNLEFNENLFQELDESVQFENITDDRQIANLVLTNDMYVPIVRTTTKYNKPAQLFPKIYSDIADNIKNIAKTKDIHVDINNAMVEIYNTKYKTMKFHSDQALDLAKNSYICIFSCYSNSKADIRKLQIKNKSNDNSSEYSEILMKDNSVIIFSTETNKKYLHKIILNNSNENNKNIQDKQNNKWLGITFRLSHTFIKFINEVPYFMNNQELKIANDDERKEFYKCKGLENIKTDYNYPEIFYTISISDTLMIK